MVPKQYSTVENGKGLIGNEKGNSLYVNFEAYEWSIRICRTDHQEDERFFSLNNKEVTPEQIREFVPNWEKLDWKNGGFKDRCNADFIQDGDYKLYLVLFENASISADNAIEQFKCFMSA